MRTNGFGTAPVEELDLNLLNEMHESPAPIGATTHGEDDLEQQEGIAAEELDEYEDEDPIDYDGINGLNEKTLTELGQLCKTLIEDGVSARKDKESDIERYRGIYKCKTPMHDGPWPNSCKLVPPDVRSTVETIVAREMESLFGKEPWLTVTPLFETDMDAAQKVVEFCMSEAKSKAINLVAKMIVALKTAHIDGTHFAYSCWKKQMRTVKRRVRVDNRLLAEYGIPPVTEPENYPWVVIDGMRYQFGKKYLMEREVPFANHFDLKFFNVTDSFIFPATATIDDATIFGFVFGKTRAEIEYGVKDGLYDEKQVEKLWKDGAVTPRSYATGIGKDVRRQSYNDQGVKDRDALYVNKYGDVELAHFVFHGRVSDLEELGTDYDNDFEYDEDDLPVDLLVTMETSSGIILSCQKNPYHNNVRPFKDLTPESEIGWGFYGESLVGKLEDLHYELTALTRQGIDRSSLSGTVIIEEDAGTRRSKAKAVFTTGVQYRRTDIDGAIVKVHTFPNLDNSNMVNREEVRRALERLSGAAEIATGGTTTTTKTLGETNIMMQAGGIRLKLFLVNELDFLTWFWNQFIDYHRQYMEDSRRYTIYKDGKEVTQEITLDELSIPCTVESYSSAVSHDEQLRVQFAEKIFTAIATSSFNQIDEERKYVNLRDFVTTLGERNFEAKAGTREEAKEAQAIAAQQAAKQPPAPIGAEGMPEDMAMMMGGGNA